VAALPAAVLLAAINSWVFADLNSMNHEPQTKVETTDGVSIVSDGSGRMVIDLSDRRRPAPPAPPLPPRMPAVPEPPAERSSATPQPALPSPVPSIPSATPAGRGMSVAISRSKAMSFWEENADLAIGRYYLLLAWAAIYLALANAQQARAAERREGEFRRAAQVAELRSLRHQVNPHFLFNTLNSLSALVLTGRHEGAERMIQMLSSFYRRSLGGDPTGDLTLGEEIGLQKLYLEIETVRFPERLRTVIDVPEALTDACVPGMILQPLVENSIKHGVAMTTSPVTLTIAAWPEGERLAVSVSDDGPGTGGGGSDGLGIGLANVRDRLLARFGDDASLDAETMPTGGFRAVMRLPLQRRHG
jgi:signal transduction histidine kinase